MESLTGRPSPLTKAPARRKLSHRSSEHDCKSQDCVGEIGTGIRVGKRSENTDFWQETARRIIRISPTQSWDLHFRKCKSFTSMAANFDNYVMQ